MKPLSMTVVIPTCYGGDSLVSTVRSLRASKGVGAFRLIVVADRTPIEPGTRKILEKLGVELHWNTKEGSQLKKLRQGRDMVKTDVCICTQDDIYFEPETLGRIMDAFRRDPKLTMTACGVLPVAGPQTYVERAMGSNIRMVYNTAQVWNAGDNYLAASGRCLAFKTAHFKKYRMPEEVVNVDMYFYLENKRLDGRFAMLSGAKVFIRPPQRMRDQVGPSSRFQYQQQELQKRFKFDISREYRVPPVYAFRSLVYELATHPVGLFCYLYVFAYTRLKKQPAKTVSNPNWTVDESTKKM